MEIKKLKCPECGANFESDEKVSFCSHCGAKLFFDDGTKTVNYNYRTEDIAKIKEVEANKEIKMQENNIMLQKQGVLFILLFVTFIIILIISAISNNYIFLSLTLVFACIIGCYIILFKYSYNDVAVQKRELQYLVEEINKDIKKGKYEEALIKTKLLHYTANVSIEDKKKWDDIRESLIKIIEEKMKN